LTSFSLLKDLSALATVTGVVRRILGTPLLAGPPPIGGYGGRLLYAAGFGLCIRPKNHYSLLLSPKNVIDAV